MLVTISVRSLLKCERRRPDVNGGLFESVLDNIDLPHRPVPDIYVDLPKFSGIVCRQYQLSGDNHQWLHPSLLKRRSNCWRLKAYDSN